MKQTMLNLKTEFKIEFSKNLKAKTYFLDLKMSLF